MEPLQQRIQPELPLLHKLAPTVSAKKTRKRGKKIHQTGRGFSPSLPNQPPLEKEIHQTGRGFSPSLPKPTSSRNRKHQPTEDFPFSAKPTSTKKQKQKNTNKHKDRGDSSLPTQTNPPQKCPQQKASKKINTSFLISTIQTSTHILRNKMSIIEKGIGFPSSKKIKNGVNSLSESEV